MWGSAAELAGGRVEKCLKHLLYQEWGRMGEGGAGDTRKGERERAEGRDKSEHLKYPLVTTAANDEAVLGPRRGYKGLAWQPERNGR